MNYSSPVFRERIRLIKPSRPQAPTEYHLQYKKWPFRPFAFDTFWTGSSKHIKKTIPSAAEIETESCKSFSSSYPGSSVGSEASCSAIVNLSEEGGYREGDLAVERDVFSKDYTVESSLKTHTAKIHARPKKALVRFGSRKSIPPSESSRGIKQSLSSPLHQPATSESKEFGDGFNRLNSYAVANTTSYHERDVAKSKTFPSSAGEDRYEGSPLSRKKREAWASPEAEDVSASFRSAGEAGWLRSKDMLRIKDLYNALENISPTELTQKKAEDFYCLDLLPSEKSNFSARSELVPQKSEKSQKKNKYKQKNRKYHSVHGLNENSLRKLYANLSTRDEAPKPDSNVTHEGKKKEKQDDAALFSQEDINMLQEDTRKSDLLSYAQTRPTLPMQGMLLPEWNTSYNMDFRNWYLEKKRDVEVLEPDDSKAVDHNKGDLSSDANKPVKESGTKQEKTNVGALVTTQQLEEDKETLPQHRENKEMTNAIKERLMKEAELIENAEYETLFRKDGRPKMEAHTTSGTFKAWKAKKPEVPIWADKTMVSLGSGHWNLPMCRNDDWKLRTGATKKKTRPNTSPIYKFKVWDGRVLDRRPTSGKERITGRNQPGSGDAHELDPIVGMHYADRTNNSTYQTEYMTKFRRVPMRRSRRL